MINDKAMRKIVEATMLNNLVLNDGETEVSVIDGYFNHRKHKNYIIDDEVNGYLCVAEYDDFVIVLFAWHIGTFATLKKMVHLAKALHKIYTVKQNKAMYYSGKTNLYANHSISIAENVWQFTA